MNSLIFLAAPFLSFASTERNACDIKESLRNKMNLIASNIVNIDTTRTPEGGPYRRKELVCIEKTCEVKYSSEILMRYEPHHPDANVDGYVSYPDIDLMQEIDSMIQATRDFEEAATACK